jgi:hypothetical protein
MFADADLRRVGAEAKFALYMAALAIVISVALILMYL